MSLEVVETGNAGAAGIRVMDLNFRGLGLQSRTGLEGWSPATVHPKMVAVEGGVANGPGIVVLRGNGQILI